MLSAGQKCMQPLDVVTLTFNTTSSRKPSYQYEPTQPLSTLHPLARREVYIHISRTLPVSVNHSLRIPIRLFPPSITLNRQVYEEFLLVYYRYGRIRFRDIQCLNNWKGTLTSRQEQAFRENKNVVVIEEEVGKLMEPLTPSSNGGFGSLGGVLSNPA